MNLMMWSLSGDKVQDWVSKCLANTRANLQLPPPTRRSHMYSINTNTFRHTVHNGDLRETRLHDQKKKKDCSAQCAADVYSTGTQKVLSETKTPFLSFTGHRLKSKL